jgi:uncharacterized membrane protein
MARSSEGEAVVPLVRSVSSLPLLPTLPIFLCHVFFALAARCPEDESVTAQDGGGTRNVKHHGQKRETMCKCNFNDIF